MAASQTKREFRRIAASDWKMIPSSFKTVICGQRRAGSTERQRGHTVDSTRRQPPVNLSAAATPTTPVDQTQQSAEGRRSDPFSAARRVMSPTADLVKSDKRGNKNIRTGTKICLEHRQMVRTLFRDPLASCLLNWTSCTATQNGLIETRSSNWEGAPG